MVHLWPKGTVIRLTVFYRLGSINITRAISLDQQCFKPALFDLNFLNVGFYGADVRRAAVFRAARLRAPGSTCCQKLAVISLITLASALVNTTKP